MAVRTRDDEASVMAPKMSLTHHLSIDVRQPTRMPLTQEARITPIFPIVWVVVVGCGDT